MLLAIFGKILQERDKLKREVVYIAEKGNGESSNSWTRNLEKLTVSKIHTIRDGIERKNACQFINMPQGKHPQDVAFPFMPNFSSHYEVERRRRGGEEAKKLSRTENYMLRLPTIQ